MEQNPTPTSIARPQNLTMDPAYVPACAPKPTHASSPASPTELEQSTAPNTNPNVAPPQETYTAPTAKNATCQSPKPPIKKKGFNFLQWAIKPAGKTLNETRAQTSIPAPVTTPHDTKTTIPPQTTRHATKEEEQKIDQPSHQNALATLMTLNIRGLLYNSCTLRNAITTYQPQIITVTETKLRPKHHRCKTIQNLLQDYEYLATSQPVTMHRDPNHKGGKAGVLVAIHKNYTYGKPLQQVDTPISLKGYLIHILTHNSQDIPIHIIGVYAPEESTIRADIYYYLQAVQNKATSLGHKVIATGDWNATLMEDDRSNNTSDQADTQHRIEISKANMAPIHKTQGKRQHTFIRQQLGEITHTSRIDDTLTDSNTAKDLEGYCTEAVPILGGNLDHSPLIHTIPGHTIFPSPDHTWRTNNSDPNNTTHGNLVLPITKDTLEKAREAISIKIGAESCILQTKIAAITKMALKAIGENQTADNIMQAEQQGKLKNIDVNQIAKEIDELLAKAHATLLNVAPIKPPNTGKRYLNRKNERQMDKLYCRQRSIKLLLHTLRQENTEHEQDQEDWDTRESNRDYDLALSALKDTDIHPLLVNYLTTPNQDPESKKALEEGAKETLKLINTQTQSLQRTNERETRNKYRANFRKTLATRPKVAHRQIFRDKQDKDENAVEPMTAIKHPKTGQIERSREGILDAFKAYFHKLLTPTFGKVTGNYLPHKHQASQHKKHANERTRKTDQHTRINRVA